MTYTTVETTHPYISAKPYPCYTASKGLHTLYSLSVLTPIRGKSTTMSRSVSRSRVTKISALSLASILSVTSLSIVTGSQPEAHATSSLSSLSSSSSLPSLPLPHIPSHPLHPSKPSVPSQPSKPAQPQPGAHNKADAAKLNQIVQETNKLRKQHGLAPVKRDGNLDKVSQNWANHLVQINELNHRPQFWTKYPNYLNRGGSENILQAWNDYSAHDLVQIWYKSPGHRANMLSPQAKSLGVGIATRHDGKLYVVQNFAY